MSECKLELIVEDLRASHDYSQSSQSTVEARSTLDSFLITLTGRPNQDRVTDATMRSGHYTF